MSGAVDRLRAFLDEHHKHADNKGGRDPDHIYGLNHTHIYAADLEQVLATAEVAEGQHKGVSRVVAACDKIVARWQRVNQVQYQRITRIMDERAKVVTALKDNTTTDAQKVATIKRVMLKKGLE